MARNAKLIRTTGICDHGGPGAVCPGSDVKVDVAFFHSIFNRDKPGLSEPFVPDALAEAELQHGDAVPTGTYLDMCAHLPVVDPGDIRCPVLIIRGEYDGIATEADLLNFFQSLPNKDKQFAILPGQAHVAPLGVNRHRFWHVMESFLTMPARVDGSGYSGLLTRLSDDGACRVVLGAFLDRRT
jgi:pimeloyl-ACP methyl ester carboxylesterase